MTHDEAVEVFGRAAENKGLTSDAELDLALLHVMDCDEQFCRERRERESAVDDMFADRFVRLLGRG